MSDPILTYKKGEGWVYAPDDFFCEALTKDGVKCRLYVREPVIGEFWVGRYANDTPKLMQDYVGTENVITLKGNPWNESNGGGIYYVLEFDE